MIPTTYAQRRHCIEVDCGIALELPFIAARLDALAHAGDEAQRFTRLYGEAHLQRVIRWFHQAQAEAPPR